MPTQKIGTPGASALQPLSALASAIGMPRASPIAVAPTASWSVAGSRSATSFSTGSRLCSDRPRSPPSARSSQSP